MSLSSAPPETEEHRTTRGRLGGRRHRLLRRRRRQPPGRHDRGRSRWPSSSATARPSRRLSGRRHRAAALQRRLRRDEPRVTNTGAFFAYVGRGLGIGPGVGGAYTSLVAYLAIQLAISASSAPWWPGRWSESASTCKWWVWTLLAWAWCSGLSAFSVDVGAKVLGVLMILEFGSPGAGRDRRHRPGRRPRLDLAASFAPEQHLRRRARRVGRYRAGLRLRLVHRLRGDRDLRRGVARTRSAPSRVRPTSRSGSSPCCSP